MWIRLNRQGVMNVKDWLTRSSNSLKIDPHSSHLPLRDLWAFKKSLNALLNAFYFLFIDMRPWKTRAKHTQHQAQFELENSIENKSCCQKSTRQCTSAILFGLNCKYSAKISDKKKSLKRSLKSKYVNSIQLSTCSHVSEVSYQILVCSILLH